MCTAWSCGKSTNEAVRHYCACTAGRGRRTHAALLCAFCDVPGDCAATGRRDWYYWAPGMRRSTGVRGLLALRRVNLTLRCGSWRACAAQWCKIRMLRAALAQRWRASRLLHVSCGHLHRGLVSRSRHHSWGGRPPSWYLSSATRSVTCWVPELDFCPVSSLANSQARWLGCIHRTIGPWRTLRVRGAT